MAYRESFQPNLVPNDLDAIVIGSGIGGLSAAALLAKLGKKVLVLERHYVAGGFTHTFQRKGYEWDVGVHYIGEVHRKEAILRKIFDHITDGNLHWQPMDEIYDRFCFGDEVYDYVAPLSKWKEKMKRYFPGEEKAIEEYVQKVLEVVQSTRSFFMERALPPLLGKVAYPFMSRKFHRYSDKSTLEVLKSLTDDPKLIGVLAGQYGDYGLPPARSSFAIHALVTNHYFEGGNYPIGGSAEIAKTICPVIEEAGGKVLVRAEVEEILLQRGKAIGVLLKGGEEIHAPIVISDVGIFNTFEKFLSPQNELTKQIKKNFKNVERSGGHLCLYVGIKESAKSLGLGTTNYWLYPDYDHDKNMESFIHDPEAPFPVVYLSFPSAKDPEFEKKYPNRATIEAVTFAPYDWFKKWENTEWHKRGIDYETLKENFSQRLLEHLYRWVPQVKGKINYYELSTPLSTRHFANYERGEIYGLDHTPQRFRQRWLRPQTPIKNLYLTGQDVVTDGIGGALLGGVLTTSVVTGKNILGKILE